MINKHLQMSGWMGFGELFLHTALGRMSGESCGYLEFAQVVNGRMEHSLFPRTTIGCIFV